MDEEVLAALRAGGDAANPDGPLGPSSTWTYMINDNPTGDILARLMRGLKWLVGRQT